MASNVSRRTATLARRYNVDQAGNGAQQSISLARSLALARMVLWANREALKHLKALAASPPRPAIYSRPEFHRNTVVSAVSEAEKDVQESETEVRGLERRCADAGLTEKEIGELSR